MKAKVRKSFKTTFCENSSGIAVAAVCFLFGAAVGCIFVANSEKSFFANLIGSDLNAFIADGTYEYSYFKTFLNLVKYPIFLFLSAFTAFGPISIPLFIFLKGTMISISISSVIAAYGKKGVIAALSLFGFQTAVSIPCVLILAAMSFNVSKMFLGLLMPQGRRFAGKRVDVMYFVMVSALLFVFLLVAALVDFAITPALISFSLKAILR